MTKAIFIFGMCACRRVQRSLLFLMLSLVLSLAAITASALGEMPLTTPPTSLQGLLGRWHQAHYLRDKSGADFDQIRQLSDDHWLNFSGSLSEGFTSAAVWVRFQMTPNRVDEPGEWFLEVSQPLLADVRLFTITQEGVATEQYGTNMSAQQKKVLNYKNPTFVLKDQISGAQTYWLRLSSPTAMQTSIALYKASKLMDKHARYDFLWGMVFGTYMFVVIFFTLFWFWTRERLHLYYTLYSLINFLAAVFTSGWPLQYIDGMTSHEHITYLGLWVSLSLTTGTLMSSEFLQLEHKHPLLRAWLLRIAVFLSVVGVIGTLLNHYALFIPPLQIASLLIIFCLMVLVIQRSLAGDHLARIFLIAFSLFYIGVAWRYMRNWGWVEPNFWSDNSYQLGAFAHMLVMSTTIFSRYNKLSKEKDQAQMQLQYESKLRSDQGKFIDMVSHEFRTPLSVVQATIANLKIMHGQHQASADRIEKIDRACERMETLIQNYLNNERMMLDAHTPSMGRHNLASICRLAMDDLAEEHRGRIHTDFAQSPTLICDMDLIRIAVLNLLDNACKYTPQNQSVLLAIHASDRFATVEVRDTGSGIPDSETERIFERHYRVGQCTSNGSGLGLYLVKSIATGHQGKIHLLPNSPSGCIFRLELPL